MDGWLSSDDIDTARKPPATLGLEHLKLGNEPSGTQTPPMPKKGRKASDKLPETVSKNALPNRGVGRWYPNPQAPVYRPLDIPPLGSTQHATSQLSGNLEATQHEPPTSRIRSSLHGPIPITQQRRPSRPLPSHGTLDQKAKQYSTAAKTQSTPRPAEVAPLPSSGRWFGSAPTQEPKPVVRILRSSSPERTVKPPPTPIPGASYLNQSATPTSKLPAPQPLLLVLDLNGTLLYRPKASSAYKPRPSLEPFLAHCISNYKVLVWSSATSPNVTAVCSKIFSPEQRTLLLGEWARDTLDLTPRQYRAPVQVYKRLDRIWGTNRVQRAHPGHPYGGRWSQKNTLLLDDSVLKASAQPYNAVVVPGFLKGSGEQREDGKEVLGQVVAYLEEARKFDDMSSFAKRQPFRVNEGWGWDWEEKRMPTIDLTGDSDEEIGGVTLHKQ
ncbi:MAG: hypothetical protein Q9170_000233 [Blastenia crenularia]